MADFENLYKEHIEDFKKSGISDETIENLIEEGYLTSHDFYWQLIYPDLLENTHSCYYTTRQDCPYEDENGKEIGKYVRPRGEPSRIYRPSALNPEILLDPGMQLIITDGEKKAIKAAQDGYKCIAIAGVNGFLDANDEEDRLISDMHRIPWEERDVYIAFHNDIYVKEYKQRALIKLALILSNQFGAYVRMLSLPDCRKTGRELGLDDFLKEYGGGALHELPITYITQDNARTLFVEEDKINFPVEIFPNKIRDFVTTSSNVLDAPIEFIACSLIGSVAILINAKATIAIKKDWVEPCILWVMLVAKPGVQIKSPCLKLIKKMIDDLDEELYQKYEKEIEEFNEKARIYNERLKEWEENGKEGDPPERPINPKRSLIYTSDTTKEAIIEIQKGSKNSISVINDEISSFLRGLNQYKPKGNELQYFLAAWTGDRHVTTRKVNKEITITHPCHSILGTTQPSEVENLLITDVNPTNGLLERWLYCMSDYIQKGKLNEEDIPQELIENIENLFRTIFEIENANFTLAKEAREVFNRYFEEISSQCKDPTLPALLKSYLLKQRSYVARFALILQCLKDHTTTILDKEVMQNAIKLSSYFVECFKKISKVALELKNNSKENYALEYMRTKKLNHISPSKLHLMNKSRFRNTKEAQEVLEHLCNQNYGYMVEMSNGYKFILY